MTDKVLWSEAVYGAVTRQPMVKIQFGSETTLISSENAREVGRDIILTALAADADAFLIEFLQEKLGIELQQAVAVMADFREWRIEKGQSQ